LGPDQHPSLSVVVVTYRMVTQIGNTLRSLTLPYQRGLAPDEYEIILVDNGSPEPLPEAIWKVSETVSYTYIPADQASPSPGPALNAGVATARAPIVCVMIDGARMVSPGVLRWGLRMTRLAESAVTEVRSWHLGPKRQKHSIEEGYTPEVERQLLESVRWYDDGYRLFEISVPTRNVQGGFFGRTRESNCVFIHRSLYERIGGYDERYQFPGGGFVNRDFFWRAVTTAETVFTLLGEGTFHQEHGGAATGQPTGPSRREVVEGWRAEYAQLSRPFERQTPPYEPILVGHLPDEYRRWLLADSTSQEPSESPPVLSAGV
jgi:glycosyltransferase involved in cell wall biosynthesis